MKYLLILFAVLIPFSASAITLVIDNNTSGTLSYLGGAATVSPSGTLTVPLTQLFPISRDTQLVSDCKTGNAQVTDGLNVYMGDDCLNYLGSIANSLGGQVVGYIGGAIPSFAIVVGAKNASGNTQIASLNTNNALVVSTNAVSSGTPTQTSVSCATSSTTLLAASAASQFISIRNPTSATATVWVNIAAAAAVTAAPSIDLAPGAEADYFASENSFLPTAQINCISGGASASTLTVIYK